MTLKIVVLCRGFERHHFFNIIALKTAHCSHELLGLSIAADKVLSCVPTWECGGKSRSYFFSAPAFF
jgi:hypothetical protein